MVSRHAMDVWEGHTMGTSATEHKELARRISEEAWGKGNLDVIDDYFAEDFVSHNPAMGGVARAGGVQGTDHLVPLSVS